MFTDFKPELINAFKFTKRNFNFKTGEIELHYALDEITFTEKIILPCDIIPTDLTATEISILEKAVGLLHFIAGVSYFKAATPNTIIDETETIDQELSVFLKKLYENGLAEFAHRNNIKLKGKINFPISAKNSAEYTSIALDADKILIPLGGGKDSLVTFAAAKESHKFKVTPIVVGESNVFSAVLSKISESAIIVKRILPVELIEINKVGALNGHVPISAILGAIFTIVALLTRTKGIAMSQEHSSNIPNIITNEEVVNHQYSKSLEYEADFAKILKSKISSELEYFSPLRPLSELAICKKFSTLTEFHDTFSSCNKNFRHTKSNAPNTRWCCHCPKCAFVFLALAAFMKREDVLEIFGHNLLNQSENQLLFEELLGISGHKPFECVGEIEEARCALLLLSEKASWQGSALLPLLMAKLPTRDTAKLLAECLKLQPHRIPEIYLDILNEIIRA